MKKAITDFFQNLAYTVRAVAHLRPNGRLKYKKLNSGRIYVLGNGPSLKGELAALVNNEQEVVTFAVNDFGVSDYYAQVKPAYYILVDPAYWNERVNDLDKELREKSYLNMNKLTQWPMTLFVPSKVVKLFKKRQFITNSNINICPIYYTNFYPTKTSFYKYVLKHNLGVVPAGNVLCQAIYASINLGFDEILVYGAEHSWTKDIRVNERNEVCTIKKHFFDDIENHLIPWQKANGKVFKMYEILTSLGNSFYGYHFLDWYSKEVGARIYNCTPYSFIDAFERKFDK